MIYLFKRIKVITREGLDIMLLKIKLKKLEIKEKNYGIKK